MTERVTTGYAALQTDSGNVPTDGPYVVHGVAIGENDVTVGGSGKQTLWPRETLKEAAEGLQGQPLATDSNHTADNPKAQTPVEAIAGEVTWSGYKPGVGVLYEAEIDDEDLAKKVNNGRLEVSPLVSRELEALEDDTAEYKATEITRWRDLALVANGAAPSNEITVGSNPMKAEALHETIEALQDGPALDESVDLPERIQNAGEAAIEADEKGWIPDSCGTGRGTQRAEQGAENDVIVADLLTRENGTPIPAYLNSHEEDLTADGPPTEWGEDEWSDCGNAGIGRWLFYTDWFKEKANELAEARGEEQPYESMASTQGTNQATEIPNTEALKEVAGVTFDGTATGKLDESEIPNEGYEPHYLYPADTKTESSYPVVDEEGNLRRGNVDAAWGLGARGDVSEERHDERLMDLAKEFDNPPEWAMDDAESMADIATQIRNPAGVCRGFEGLFDPIKHPRNPENGKFVERPYPVPDDIADMGTSDIVSELSDRDPNFASKIDGLDIGLGEDTRQEAVGENSAFDTDITQKSTEELVKLKDFLMEKHSNARDAQDPAADRKERDTQMDKLMKSTLSKVDEIDRVLDSRSGA